MYEILAVHKELIKQMLIDRKYKTYSLIAKFYSKELVELGPTVFRNWLANKLELSEDWINVKSLHSALTRSKRLSDNRVVIKKKHKKKNKR